MSQVLENLQILADGAFPGESTTMTPGAIDAVKAGIEEIKRLRNKCGELGEDLIAAVGVAHDHGATDWVKKNYPDFPAFEYERSA